MEDREFFSFEEDKIHEECGIFGITKTENSNINVAGETQFGLYALQHRGQESCGISVNDCGVITTVKDVGLVPEVFTKEVMEKFPLGQMAIGHVRYSTIGQASAVNAQPIIDGSALSRAEHRHHDHFTDTHPDTNWQTCLEHGEKLGLGTRQYELIKVK